MEKSFAKKPSRRPFLKGLPVAEIAEIADIAEIAEIFMEPRSPVLLKSRDTAGYRSKATTSWVPEETTTTPVHRWKEESGSKRQELDQEWWSFCVGKPSRWNRPTKKWTSTFESVFADGGISIRVQKPPFETPTTTTTTTTTGEDEDRDEDASRTAGLEVCEEKFADESFARRSKRELRELPEANTRVSSQADADELDEIEQVSRSGGENVGARAAVRLLSPSPSLSTPVMEKMEAAAASLEVPCPWNKREAAKSGEQREQGELLHPSTKTVDPARRQEVSFRLWDREATPKPVEAREEQDGSDDEERARNGFSSLDDGGGDDEIVKKMPSPNLEIPMNLQTLNLRSKRVIATKLQKVLQEDFGEELEHNCPTSLFPYKEEPFQPSVASGDDILSTFQQFCDSGASSCEEIRNGSFRRSPRSVLLQDSDETSQCTSDSSGATGKKRLHKQQQQQQQYQHQHRQKHQHQQQHQQQQKQQQKQTSSFVYFYNDDDESSDLESPLQCKFRHELLQAPFAAFTYSVGTAMLATSPSAASTSACSASSSADKADFADYADFAAGPVQELGFFHEAKIREPWLVNDGGVLDDSEDVEYLSSPDLKARVTTTMTTTLVPIALPLRSPELRNGLPIFMQSPPIEEMPGITDRKAKRESPKSKLVRHKAKFEIRKAKHDSPKAKDESVKPKPESRRTRPTVPKPKLDSPKTKPDSPKIKPESPKTEHESPKTEHESPKTEHERRKVKHGGERGPKSEKKWVPFVTSSLHSNKPPQVCNPVAKGSPTQNSDSEKSTNQGRAPATIKAPKRCVKFAPDLVNFAPDLVRETPDSATTPAAADLDRKQQKQQPAVPRANPTARKQNSQPPAGGSNTILVRSKPKSKAWEVEVDDDDDKEGPSIMNSRRQSRWRIRDAEESKSSVGSSGRRERAGSLSSSSSSSSTSSCAERLLSWPRRLAHKVDCRTVDSDDDDAGVVVVGERSFGMSSRRDAELVRKILKGSRSKYSNLTGDDILNEDFG